MSAPAIGGGGPRTRGDGGGGEDRGGADLAGLAGAVSVRRWLEHGGPDVRPAEEQAEALVLLARFLAFTGLSPDELVARCLRTTRDGARAISAGGRRWADEAIEAFVALEGLSGHEAVATGNRLRSFLIHNGIFLQGRASTS